MEASPKKPLRKRLLIVCVLVISLLILEGCGKREVEELAFMMGVGIDKGKQEGSYLVTIQVAKPKPSGGGGSTELEDWTLSVEGPIIASTIEKVNEMFDKQFFAGTVRVIVIGEDLARTGINEVLDFYQRYYQYRRTMYLVVAKGSAKDLLETKTTTHNIPALGLLGIIEGNKRQSTFPVTRLGHYLTILGRESQNPVIPSAEVIRSGDKGIYLSDEKGNEVIMSCAGVFEDGRLVDFLGDQETKGYLWLDDEIKTRRLEGERDRLKIVASVHNSKTKYKVEMIDEQLGIKFYIKASMALDEILGQQGEMSTEEWRNFLQEVEPILAQAIQEECEAAVAKSKKLQLDFIGIGRKIEIKNPKYWTEIKDNWPQGLEDFPVAFEIEVDVDHAGLARNSPVSPQKSESKGEGNIHQ
ncbi:Ger(x)C family spore germination protein [Desulfitobacterium sp. THU1]|uniref:Ger(x)C family spore germination protein n=1 Tax=Desulfitobacterium sp. THU1 TaxID=3138072 RepID=UPI00311F9281